MNCASTCTLKINNVKFYDALLINSENFITCMIKIIESNIKYNRYNIAIQSALKICTPEWLEEILIEISIFTSNSLN